MLGSTNNPGITFRTVMELYRKIDEMKEESSVEVAVSYLEVYNESIIDLINPETGQLAIRDDGKSAINIPGTKYTYQEDAFIFQNNLKNSNVAMKLNRPMIFSNNFRLIRTSSQWPRRSSSTSTIWKFESKAASN